MRVILPYLDTCFLPGKVASLAAPPPERLGQYATPSSSAGPVPVPVGLPGRWDVNAPNGAAGIVQAKIYPVNVRDIV